MVVEWANHWKDASSFLENVPGAASDVSATRPLKELRMKDLEVGLGVVECRTSRLSARSLSPWVSHCMDRATPQCGRNGVITPRACEANQGQGGIPKTSAAAKSARNGPSKPEAPLTASEEQLFAASSANCQGGRAHRCQRCHRRTRTTDTVRCPKPRWH